MTWAPWRFISTAACEGLPRPTITTSSHNSHNASYGAVRTLRRENTHSSCAKRAALILSWTLLWSCISEVALHKTAGTALARGQKPQAVEAMMEKTPARAGELSTSTQPLSLTARINGVPKTLFSFKTLRNQE